MILSIVIPTLNRAQLLADLLLRLAQEIAWLPKHLQERVEVVVGDNACEDTTGIVVNGYLYQPWFKYRRFSERVGADESIARTVELGNGQFIWVFGDDDAMVDGFLRPMIELLLARPDHVLYYFNRLVMDSDFRRIVRVAHLEWGSEREELPLSEFIRRFTHWPGFITSLVFRKEHFILGGEYAIARYAGWTQLARIFFGVGSGSVCIVNYPAVAQRLGIHLWKESWPRYWLVNMPTMLVDLEERGITSGALKTWRDNEVSYYRLAADALVAKSYGIARDDDFWSSAINYQVGMKRGLLICARYFLPCRLAAGVYGILQSKYR